MALPNMLIYAVEDAWEKAVTTLLSKNGVNDVNKQRDYKQVLEDGSVQVLKTPRVEAKFLFGGFGIEHYYVVPATSQRWMDIGTGVGYLKIVTRRDVAEPSHSYLRGLCRFLMQKVSDLTDSMPLHKVEKMIEQSSTVTFEGDKLHDVSALSFQTWIRIRQSAFPTS